VKILASTNHFARKSFIDAANDGRVFQSKSVKLIGNQKLIKKTVTTGKSVGNRLQIHRKKGTFG